MAGFLTVEHIPQIVTKVTQWLEQEFNLNQRFSAIEQRLKALEEANPVSDEEFAKALGITTETVEPVIADDARPYTTEEQTAAETPLEPVAVPVTVDKTPAPTPAPTKSKKRDKPAEAAPAVSAADFLVLAEKARADKEVSREEFGNKMQQAHIDLLSELDTRDLWFNMSNAEFVDQKTDYQRRAYSYLQIQLANSKFETAAEAIDFALEYDAKYNSEPECEKTRWLSPARLYPPLRDALRERGLELHRWDKRSGADIHVGMSELVRSEIKTVSEAIEIALGNGWAYTPKQRGDDDAPFRRKGG